LGEPYKVVPSFLEIPGNPVSFATTNLGKFKPQFLAERAAPSNKRRWNLKKLLPLNLGLISFKNTLGLAHVSNFDSISQLHSECVDSLALTVCTYDSLSNMI